MGFVVGFVVGDDVGFVVGDDVGFVVGDDVGFVVGDDVGFVVGDDVGFVVGQTPQSSGQLAQVSFSSHTPLPQYASGTTSHDTPWQMLLFASMMFPL